MKTIIHFVLTLSALLLATPASATHTQGSMCITAETAVPVQIGITQSPFYIGLDATPGSRISVRVYEISPIGVPKTIRTLVVQIPRAARLGVDAWIRVWGLKVGYRYAVTFAPTTLNGVCFQWHIQDSLPGYPTGSIKFHNPSRPGDPLHSPYPGPWSVGRDLSIVNAELLD